MGRRKNVARANEIFQTIREYWGENGISPTLDEISTETGIAKSVVYHYIGVLEQIGWIKRHDRSARSIVVVGAVWTPPAPKEGG